MALQDGMVLQLQADPIYSSLVSGLSTVPVGAVNKQVYPLVIYHQGTILDLADVHGSTGNRTARVQLALCVNEHGAVVGSVNRRATALEVLT